LFAPLSLLLAEEMGATGVPNHEQATIKDFRPLFHKQLFSNPEAQMVRMRRIRQGSKQAVFYYLINFVKPSQQMLRCRKIIRPMAIFLSFD